MEEIHSFAFPLLLIQNNVPLLGDLRKLVMIATLTLKGIQCKYHCFMEQENRYLNG